MIVNNTHTVDAGSITKGTLGREKTARRPTKDRKEAGSYTELPSVGWVFYFWGMINQPTKAMSST